MELTIEFKAKPGNFQELDQTLQALLPTIRKEKGCQGCRIYRDMEDGEIFFLSVQWKAQANLEQYMRSTHGMVLLGAIDVLSEKATVKIGREAPWEGIEVLKRMRKENNSPSRDRRRQKDGCSSDRLRGRGNRKRRSRGQLRAGSDI